MTGRTTELARVNDKSLVLWEKSSGMEFVVCTNYDSKKPVGSQWCWGHYFTSVFDAVDYMGKVSYMDIHAL